MAAHHGRHLVIVRGELDRAVDQQAPLPALGREQVLDEAVEVAASLGDRGARFVEVAQLLRHDQLRVAVERADEQGTLATRESPVQTARLDPGGPHQVVDGRGAVATLPELTHDAVENLLGLELSATRHEPERYLNDHST